MGALLSYLKAIWIPPSLVILMILVIWSFCVQEVPSCVPGGPRRESLELQNGGLRALEEALNDVRLAVNRQPGFRQDNS